MPSSPDGPSTGVLASWLDGWRRALGAPAITVGVMLATFVTAVPLALTVGDRIEADLGASAEATRVADAWNPDWAGEFGARTEGVARTFTHEIIGFGATMATVSRFVDARSIDPSVAMAVGVYVGLWMFLWGGILDRFARRRPTRTAAFFSSCGVYFWRFARLVLITGPLYWVLFAWVHPMLFDTLYDRWTADLTVERDAVVLRACLYVVFLSALAFVGLLADFAKVRAVVEDRRSMVGAFLASWRFVRRRLPQLAGLYLLNVLVFGLILLVWSAVAPGATAPVALGFLVTETYLLLRVWNRLALAGAEVAFLQGALAHAGYAAAPLPVWPDSPTVEGLRNLTER